MIKIIGFANLFASFIAALILGVYAIFKIQSLDSVLSFVHFIPLLMGLSFIFITLISSPISFVIVNKYRKDFWSLNFSKFILLITYLAISLFLLIMLFSFGVSTEKSILFSLVTLISCYISSSVTVSYIFIKDFKN